MILYYTVDVKHDGRWYEKDVVNTYRRARELCAKYSEDDSFDEVKVSLHEYY